MELNTLTQLGCRIYTLPSARKNWGQQKNPSGALSNQFLADDLRGLGSAARRLHNQNGNESRPGAIPHLYFSLHKKGRLHTLIDQEGKCPKLLSLINEEPVSCTHPAHRWSTAISPVRLNKKKIAFTTKWDCCKYNIHTCFAMIPKIWFSKGRNICNRGSLFYSLTVNLIRNHDSSNCTKLHSESSNKLIRKVRLRSDRLEPCITKRIQQHTGGKIGRSGKMDESGSSHQARHCIRLNMCKWTFLVDYLCSIWTVYHMIVVKKR